MELKQGLIFVLVLMSVSVGGTVGLNCQMSSFLNCPKYELISTKTFQGFISLKSFNSRCNNMKMALDCAVSNSYLVGCSERDLLDYNMVKNLQASICQQFKTEYRENIQCILSETVKFGVEMCVYEMSVQESDPDFCRYLGEGLNCVQQVIDSTMNGNCDGNVLVKILRSYLLPLGQLHNCPGYEETTTTTSGSSTFRSSTALTTRSTSVGPSHLLVTARDEPVRYGQSRSETNAGTSTNQRCSNQNLLAAVCISFFCLFIRHLPQS